MRKLVYIFLAAAMILPLHDITLNAETLAGRDLNKIKVENTARPKVSAVNFLAVRNADNPVNAEILLTSPAPMIESSERRFEQYLQERNLLISPTGDMPAEFYFKEPEKSEFVSVEKKQNFYVKKFKSIKNSDIETNIYIPVYTFEGITIESKRTNAVLIENVTEKSVKINVSFKKKWYSLFNAKIDGNNPYNILKVLSEQPKYMSLLENNIPTAGEPFVMYETVNNKTKDIDLEVYYIH
ncbi:hypothetical protein Dip510_000928 [Elusimicrobium posterum]|uniref:hypothetical protein n=1 Tax=Elusimicrobium posterum TaxID=3116653 RepID=UPI003C733932